MQRGTWTLEISAYGFVAATAELTIAAGDVITVDVALDAAAVHRLSGTVTAAGTPVADAAVRVHDTPLPTVFTAADGTFAVEVAAGTYAVSAEATGYERDVQTVELDGDADVRFELEAIDATIATRLARVPEQPDAATACPARRWRPPP